IELSSGFLTTLGRPPRESVCECERTNGLQLGPVMALVTGQTIADAIADPNNAIAKLVAAEKSDAAVANRLFLRILNRPATKSEIDAVLKYSTGIDSDHQQLVKALEEREKYLVPIKTELEKQRLAAIAEAEQTQASYEEELAPIVAQKEKERADGIAKLTAELTKHEHSLLAKVPEFE